MPFGYNLEDLEKPDAIENRKRTEEETFEILHANLQEALDRINHLKEEIAIANKINEVISAYILETRDHAIKEFAERLKATFPRREDPRCSDYDIYTLNVIDNLVEELTNRKE